MMEPEPVFIKDLPVPKGLLDLIATGRWKAPADLEPVRRLARDPSLKKFYPWSLRLIKQENESWRTGKHEWPGRREMFICAADAQFPPGDIDESLAIYIADNGIGSDAPYALDYRVSHLCPRIIHLFWDPDGKCEKGRIFNRWMVVAESIEHFAAQLGL